MKRYIVATKRQAGQGTTALTLRPASGQDPLRYKAGQYVAIGFRRGWQRTPMRCFSITTTPADVEGIGLAFRTAGSFTRSFAQVAEGSQVEVLGPFGEFTVPADESRPLLFLAGGIGITPILSIMRDLQQRRIKQPVTLLYSINSLQDVPFAGELAELMRYNPNYTVRFITQSVSPGDSSHPLVIQGRVSGM